MLAGRGQVAVRPADLRSSVFIKNLAEQPLQQTVPPTDLNTKGVAGRELASVAVAST